jgi:hypothetical protein
MSSTLYSQMAAKRRRKERLKESILDNIAASLTTFIYGVFFSHQPHWSYYLVYLLGLISAKLYSIREDQQ